MRPLQKTLALPGPAKYIAGIAVGLNLPGVSGKASPPFDLNPVDVRYPPTNVISAIPLKPATRIGTINPTLLLPNAQGLTTFYTEIVQLRIWILARFCVIIPRLRKFCSAIVEVAPLKNAHFKHSFRGVVWCKIFTEVFTSRLCKTIVIPGLHPVIHDDLTEFFHNPVWPSSRGRHGAPHRTGRVQIILVTSRTRARQKDLVYHMDHTIVGHNVGNDNVCHIACAVSDRYAIAACCDAQTLAREDRFEIV
jgi:hypothetical protein